jgi:hypothetical protein
MMALIDHLRVPRGLEDDIDIILYYSDHLNGKKTQENILYRIRYVFLVLSQCFMKMSKNNIFELPIRIN